MAMQLKDFQGQPQICFTIRVCPEVKSKLETLRMSKQQSLNKTVSDLIQQALNNRKLVK